MVRYQTFEYGMSHWLQTSMFHDHDDVYNGDGDNGGVDDDTGDDDDDDDDPQAPWCGTRSLSTR